MLISKNGKRIMAYIMSLAMLFACLIYVPKTADAASDTPTVTILGATLRLTEAGDNNGSQSMRVAIKVDNANNAQSCSLKLSVLGKNYVFSTKKAGSTVGENTVNKQINGVYSKTETSVIFAAVITGIPESSFYEPVHITGYADSLQDSNEIESYTESRNVRGVLNVLQSKFPSLNIDLDENGNLTKNDGEPLTNDDLKTLDENYDVPPVVKDVEEVDLSKYAIMYNQGTASYDETTHTLTGENISGFGFPLNRELSAGDKVEVIISGSYLGSNPRIWLSDSAEFDAQWTTSENINFDITYNLTTLDKVANDKTSSTKTDAITIKAQAGASFSNISISKILIKYIKSDINLAPVEPGLVDLSTFNNVENNKSAIYDETTGFVNIDADNGNTYSFDLPITVNTGDVITITITGTYDGTGPFRAWISNEVWNNASKETPTVENANGDFESSVKVTLIDPINNAGEVVKDNSGNVVKGNKVNIKAASGGKIDGKLVIKKIKLTKTEAAS